MELWLSATRLRCPCLTAPILQSLELWYLTFARSFVGQQSSSLQHTDKAEPQRCSDDLHARNAGGGPKAFRTWLLCLNTHLNPDLEAPRSLAKINYWQLLKSPLHVQFSLLESSFLPRANAAHTPGLTQIPAPVGSNTQTTQAVWALPALLCPLFFST